MKQNTDKKKEAMTRMEMRISKEDKALIEQKARKAGITTSEFIRRSALEGDFLVMEIPQFYKSIPCNLEKIGSNLNQDCKICQSGIFRQIV